MKKLIVILFACGFLFSTDMNLWVSDVTNSSVQISASSAEGLVEISGFQFNLVTDPISNNILELIDTLFVEGDTVSSSILYPISGAVTESNFTCFANPEGKIVSFSFEVNPIAFEGTQVLAEFTWDISDVAITSVTVEDPVFIFSSGESLIELSVDVGEPFVLGTSIFENISTFKLDSAYPNPFNPITAIQYTVANVGYVSIIVYDMLGREVRTLVSEHHNPATYSVYWNGMDNTNNEVSSGVYFYKMTAGDFVKTNKIVFMK